MVKFHTYKKIIKVNCWIGPRLDVSSFLLSSLNKPDFASLERTKDNQFMDMSTRYRYYGSTRSEAIPCFSNIVFIVLLSRHFVERAMVTVYKS
ncbi:uncharacterized protein LACBIDRAFT_318368 [Laccaria bicolor S238N-H82]|uniref:Predicted protein n=1 Tax=Laccaria bicolor (strain S238N-H82 / ATCC MYA-4686) TaxID=486041 RepID=B0D6K9_LACBS|nr:uncharacterized protein LACBIDRAFT_318368 [Laccaria bicolor S238N-H82]EDR09974.1 predicted protein [Laccaria bicolor S238N-H82]|eukprot:XP_001879359.1 predicted protein [Laccaria bicolor S238N-H82]